MCLLTAAAFDRGKGKDNFGAKDEDWQLYKLMSKDNDDDDDGADEDEAELACVCSRLQIDPTFVPKLESKPLQPATTEVPCVHVLTKEDFQVVLGVEKYRCPEILFHPNLVGIHQAGLNEMTAISLRRLPCKDKALEDRLTGSIFRTGRCSLVPRINQRLEAGIRILPPCGLPIKVVRALDPVLDAWHRLRIILQTCSSHSKHSVGQIIMRKVRTRIVNMDCVTHCKLILR